MIRTVSIYLLRALAILALAAVCGLVFVVSYDYPDPTVTGRFFEFCKLLLPLNILAIPLLSLSKYRFTLTDLLVSLYAAYFILHFYLTVSPAENRLILFAGLAQLYFFVRISQSFWPKLGYWALLLLFATGCGQAILGLKQIYGAAHSYHGLYSVTGSFFNPGPYGGYMAFVFCLSLSYVIRHYKAFQGIYGAIRRRKWECRYIVPALLYVGGTCCAVLSFIVIPATMSRSAWMAVAGALLLMLSVEFGLWKRLGGYYKNNKVKTTWIALAALLVLAGGIAGVYSLKKGSADGRLLAWKVTARVIANAPGGTGTGYFGGDYARAQSALFMEGRLSGEEIAVADSPAYAFNEYLQITAEQGWMGILLFLAILILSFRNFNKSRNEWQYALFALLLFALTSYPFRVLPLLIAGVVAVGLQSNGLNLSGLRWGKVMAGILLLSFLFVNREILQNLPVKEEGYRNWKSVQIFYRMDLYDDELAGDYEKHLEPMRGESAYLFEYGRTLNQIGRYAESNRILEQGSRQSSDPMFYNVMGNNYNALGDYRRAEEMYEKAFSVLPNRIYPLYLLTKLHYEHGDSVKGAYYAEKVLDFDPKVESPATNDMKKEVRELLEQE